MGSLTANDYEVLEPDLNRSRMPTGLHSHPSAAYPHPASPRSGPDAVVDRRESDEDPRIGAVCYEHSPGRAGGA